MKDASRCDGSRCVEPRGSGNVDQIWSLVVVGVNKLGQAAVYVYIYKRQAESKTEAAVEKGGEAPKVEKKQKVAAAKMDRKDRTGQVL